MAKSRHNKKRNTAFLYEVLVRELTKAAMSQDKARKAKLVGLIKEHFRKGTLLAQDLEHYRALTETIELERSMAERLLDETRAEQGMIDRRKLFNEQSKLIASINRALGQDVFNTFVPSYRSLASIYQLFNTKMPVKKRLFLEESVMSKLVSSTKRQDVEDDKMEPIGRLAYKTFIKKFNEEYSRGLLKEQQDLLGSYVLSFSDNGLDLKVRLNEELGRLKGAVKESLELDEIKSDPDMVKRTNDVLTLMESFRERPVDQGMIETVLKIQQLIHEIKDDADND